MPPSAEWGSWNWACEARGDVDLVMIGSMEAERRFASCFANHRTCKA